MVQYIKNKQKSYAILIAQLFVKILYLIIQYPTLTQAIFPNHLKFQQSRKV